MHPFLRSSLLLTLCALCSCTKPKSTALSIQGLDPANEDFAFEMADRIAEKTHLDDTPASADRLLQLPEQWRYIEPLLYYYNEVNNGGHDQYFANSRGVYRQLVSDGLKYYHATEFQQIFDEALAEYRPEDYQAKKGETADHSQQDSKEDRFDKLDSRFFKTSPDLAAILTASIRQNLNLYK